MIPRRSFIVLALCQTVLVRAGQLSFEELDRLLLSRNVEKKELYMVSLVSHIKNIEANKIDIVFALPPLCNSSKSRCVGTYFPFNPSIMKTDQGYDVICRTGCYKLPSYRPLVWVSYRNKNFFLKYDKDFNLLYEQEIPVISEEIGKNIDRATQLEDVRLFNFNNITWTVGVANIRRGPYLPKIALCRLKGSSENSPVSFQSLTIFNGPLADKWEKNWMPIVEGSKLKFIYLYDPFILLEANIENGTCKELLNYTPFLDFSRFRGSAAPIEFDNGYLMMVHEVFRGLIKRRSRYVQRDYIHRLVYLDKDFNITKISLPFKFEGISIEFCTSMTIDHLGKNLVMGVGISDSQAKLFIADLEYIKTLLRDISTYK